ncbi:MAG: DUF389 domain-containing protein [Anaerolineae bacterium]
MRVVTVNTPEGKGMEVADLALSVGIAEASVTHAYVRGPNRPMDKVEVNTSTPNAKKFVDALMAAPFYTPHDYPIVVRSIMALVTDDGQVDVTSPVVPPTIDVCEELWQFSHITPSFIGRVLVASLLLAYGMIQNNVLLIAAGLLFIPFLPLMLAMAFGTWTRDWRLAWQGLAAFATGIVVITIGSIAVSLIAGGPLRFDQFSSLGVGLAISLAVGAAAALASADDVGRRELIALAASSQLALVPAWFGISLVLGFPDTAEAAERVLGFFINSVALVVAGSLVYAFLRMRGTGLQHLIAGSREGEREPSPNRPSSQT